MDERTIIYALAGVIVTIVSFGVRRELQREKDKESEITSRMEIKDKEIERLTTELKQLREWKDKLYEEAIQKRLQNHLADRG